jgi:uncharacterized protein YdhG (YjbR/CyaY superfamily)
MGKDEPRDVDAYIAGFPAEVQEKLQGIRAIIREAAPEAEETIKYKMPTYILKGNLVFFAGYKKFISLYPAPQGGAEFNKSVAVYRAEKSTLQFPLDEPIPYGLIAEIVRFRVKENLQKAEAKKRKKGGATEAN